MNTPKNIIVEKSFQFALKSIELYKILTQGKKEFVMSKQFLKSCTSIGANIREAQNAESTMDFIHKLGIAQKEADESLYWTDLLYKSGYLGEKGYQEHSKLCIELLKIIRSIILTKKKNIKNHSQ